jgi:hypothetical protein
MPKGSQVEVAESLFQAGLEWLADTYSERVFYVERDVVYVMQTKLVDMVLQVETPWLVYNDYPMIAGPRRSLSADLAIVNSMGDVLVAAEFKYEPCHRRHDVLRNKLPVVAWADVLKDTVRTQRFVGDGKAAVAYAICVDEGGYLAGRDLSVYSETRHWDASPRHQHPVTAHVYRSGNSGQ